MSRSQALLGVVDAVREDLKGVSNTATESLSLLEECFCGIIGERLDARFGSMEKAIEGLLSESKAAFVRLFAEVEAIEALSRGMGDSAVEIMHERLAATEGLMNRQFKDDAEAFHALVVKASNEWHVVHLLFFLIYLLLHSCASSTWERQPAAPWPASLTPLRLATTST